MRNLFLLLFLLSAVVCNAAKVDTIDVYSASMKKNIRCVVVVPDAMARGEKLPTVYLLHGHGGNYKTWVTGFDTKELVDKYRVIAVSPNGEDSWYLDSPFNPKIQYETFVSKELVKYIDSNYPTIAKSSARAISGLSMGGHGALYNAIRNQDVFGAAGSMSGGVDLTPFPHRWGIANYIGEKSKYPQNWEKFSVINQLYLLNPSKPLALIIDCGTEDFFYEVNEALHNELLYLKYPHRYTTDQGGHSGEYWKKSQRYHFLFFSDFFEKEK